MAPPLGVLGRQMAAPPLGILGKHTNISEGRATHRLYVLDSRLKPMSSLSICHRSRFFLLPRGMAVDTQARFAPW